MFGHAFHRLILLSFAIVCFAVVPTVLGNDLSANKDASSPNTQKSQQIVTPPQRYTPFKADYGWDLHAFTPAPAKKQPAFSVGRLEWRLRSTPRPVGWLPRTPGVLAPENGISVSFDLRWKDR